MRKVETAENETLGVLERTDAMASIGHAVAWTVVMLVGWQMSIGGLIVLGALMSFISVFSLIEEGARDD